MSRSAGGLLLWAVLFSAGAFLSRGLDTRLEVSSRIPGSESAAVEQQLAADFGSPFASSLILVVQGLPSASSEEGRARLRPWITRIEAVEGVAGTLSSATSLDSLLVGADGEGSLVLVGIAAGQSAANVLARVRSLSDSIAGAEATRTPGLRLRWTGEAALSADMRAFSLADVRRAEWIALPLAILIAVWAFGSLGGAAVAGLVGSAAVAVGLGLASVLSRFVPLTVHVPYVVSFLGLALGIDYALFLVWRGRQSREGEHGPVARGTALLAGATVAVGLAPLAWVPVTELRTIGASAAIAVVAAIGVSLLLVPRFGAWVERGRGRVDRRPARERAWRSWGTRVVAHPWLALALTVPPLLLLGAQALRVNPTVFGIDWLPARLESVQALDALRGMGRSGTVSALRVLVDLPTGVAWMDAGGWEILTEEHARFARDPRVGAVRSLLDVSGGQRPEIVAAVVPERVRAAFVSRDGRSLLFTVVPVEGLPASETAALVRDLRDPSLNGVVGGAVEQVRVGGGPAFTLDYAFQILGAVPRVFALVVVTTFLLLLFGFRSLLLPLKALLLNLLSVGAAFGAAVLVFQDGWFPTSAGGEGIFPSILVITFCVVFGVSMDYDVFLVRWVIEARRAGASTREAIVEGLTRSAPVITGGAAVMVGISAVFAASELLPIRMMGFILATAIALDATVVRLIVAPALLTVAGEWNWWPGSSLRGSAPSPRAPLGVESG